MRASASTTPTHPESLSRLDGPYIVPWGAKEAGLSAALGSLAIMGLVGLALKVSGWWALGLVPLLPVVALLVLFFRNPRRKVPDGVGLIVSPADGTVTDIAQVHEGEFVHAPSIRIGIFLSIFNVHVNRAPASGRVEWVCHRDGAHHDARKPECATENESNLIGIVREEAGGQDGLRILIKQVSGAIARRIVCPLSPGDAVARGGLVGMIKYGSRTEIYLPASAGALVLVKPGSKVRGGSTVLAEIPQP